MKIKDLAIGFALTVCLAAQAGRSISMPNLAHRVYLQYPPVALGVPVEIGAVLTTLVTVKNLSSVPQEITVILDKGSNAYAGISTANICMKTLNDPNEPSVSSGKLILTAANTLKDKFTLNPGNLNSVSFLTVYRTSSIPSLPRAWTVLNNPAITIKVTEDKGLVQASVSLQTEGALTDTSSASCTAQASADAHGLAAPTFVNLATPAVFVNGGRPF